MINECYVFIFPAYAEHLLVNLGMLLFATSELHIGDVGAVSQMILAISQFDLSCSGYMIEDNTSTKGLNVVGREYVL